MKQETAKKNENMEHGTLLDPERKSPRAAEFEDKLSSLIVGQADETGSERESCNAAGFRRPRWPLRQ